MRTSENCTERQMGKYIGIAMVLAREKIKRNGIITREFMRKNPLS